MAAGSKTSMMTGSFRGVQEALHELLLQFPATVDPGEDLVALVSRFCRAVRQMFSASGAYCWLLDESTGLTGFAADGIQASTFPGLHMSLDQPSLARQALETGRAAFINEVDRDPAAAAGPSAILAIPLMAMSRATGVLILTHQKKDAQFDRDTASAMLVVGAHLGAVIANARMAHALATERRRNATLIEAAESFNLRQGVPAIKQSMVERAGRLLGAETTLLVWSHHDGFSIDAIASSGTIPDHPEVTGFLSELASRAVVSIDPLPGKAPEGDPLVRGQIIAAPVRTGAGRGVLLVSAGARAFHAQDEVLLAGLATFGATALTNAELQQTADVHSQDLQRLIEISSSLARGATVDRFLEQFVVRAAEFMEYERAAVILLQGDEPYVRWLAAEGKAQPERHVLRSALIREVLAGSGPFVSNDVSSHPLAEPETIEKFNIRQMLSVPMRTASGRVLGALTVLDRKDRRPVSETDRKRLVALAAEAAVVIEASENFERLEQHRRTAEDLVGLSLALNSTLQVADLAKAFTAKAAQILGAPDAAAVIVSPTGFEAIVFHPERQSEDRMLAHRLAHGLADVVSAHGRVAIHGSAGELLGDNLGQALGWDDVAIAPLASSTGDLIGMLCLANRGRALDDVETHLLHAVVAHASVAFQNSRLFSQIANSSRNWSQIFDAISDMMIVHDDHNRIVRMNRAVSEMVGVEPQQLVGMDVRALVPLCASDGSPCPFCSLDREGLSEYDNDAVQRSYLVSTARIAGAAEAQTVHILKDITDRREVERRYRELFDNIHEGLFFSTPEGRFVEVNDALVRMLGYDSREELLQVDIGTQLHLSAAHAHRFAEKIEEHGAMRSFEIPLLRKDGKIIHTLQNCYAVRDASGRSLQYRGLILDITELKSFQTELQRQRDFNLKILNNTQSVIVVCDTVGLITYANERCEIACGYDPEKLVGSPLSSLVAPANQEFFATAIEATGNGDQVESLDLPVQCADGRVVRYSIMLSPMRDEQGNVTSIIALMTDITDAAMLQSKLIHSEKMAAVGQLVSGVAHEVNNPLTAIMGYADLLNSSNDLPAEARRDLGIILQEAQRTKQIVQNLLSFARQSAPYREPVDLNAVLARTLQLRQYDFVNHGVKLEEYYDPDLPKVFGDPQQLQQVFLNVVNNAYDAVREVARPPEVRIVTSATEGLVEVEISDNGPGITLPDRIFDPFFTTKGVGKGTGLGLSICYGIVREHGGEITCSNHPDGNGATFLIRLPVLTASRQKDEVPA